MDTQVIKRREGRPTKYITSIINPKIEEYLNTCSREQTKLPSIAGLARYLDLTTSTLYLWKKEHPEFSEYIKKLADMQQEQLMSDGMYGGREVNAGMAVFLLKALHGLKENEPNTLIQINVKPILGSIDPE